MFPAPMEMENVFDCFGTGEAPVPSAHAEPVERLLRAMRPGRTLLLLGTAPNTFPGFLNAPRLYACLRDAWVEAVGAEVWPLLENVWAVSLECEHTDDPGSAVRLHTIRRNLLAKLHEEMRTWGNGGVEEADDLSSSSHSPISLSAVTGLPAADALDGNIAELNALLEIIVRGELHPQFQPIVSLRDGGVLGYEALIRGPKGALLRRPGMMYRAADKARVVAWYDLACQERCLAVAGKIGLKRLLFVNMDAEGLAYLEVQGRSLAEGAREAGLSPSRIVIEVCERQAIEEFPRLAAYIEGLREEGFKVAIDDAGAGYNSLHAIAELRPDFVKIDRSMVRNIDAHGERRALMAALVDYARRIGTNILAEGAETREELGALIDLGVPYGQGYLMGRPADDFRGVPRETREFIAERARQTARRQGGQRAGVSGLARRGLAVPPETPLAQVAPRFAKDPSLTSIAVVEEGQALGLVTRAQLENVLAVADAAHVAGMLPDETVADWMRTDVLFVDEAAHVGDAARLAAARGDVSLDSDVVLVREGQQFAGLVPIRALFEAAMTQHESRLRYADPLTGLPGRVPLEAALRERLAGERAGLAVVRADVRDLEPFNRRYGLAAGDALIEAVAGLMQSASRGQGDPLDFLAHLGGDNFVLLTGGASVSRLCRTLCEQFDALVPRLHLPEHVRAGDMELDERAPEGKRVPLCRLSVAALTGKSGRLTHHLQVADDLNALLRTLKRGPQSVFVIDR